MQKNVGSHRTEPLLGVTSTIDLATIAWMTPPAWIAVVRRENPCSLSSKARKVSLHGIRTNKDKDDRLVNYGSSE